MRRAAKLILVGAVLCLGVLFYASFARGEPTDAIDRAAASPDSVVRTCTCVEGPLADEIERLRTEVKLLRAAKLVNEGIACGHRRRGKK